jgi:hypothetical protein
MAKISTPSYMKTPGGKMGDAVFYSIGNRSYMRTYVIPRNPRTEAQQKNRSLFAEAMASWKTLTSEEKYLYKTRTRDLDMHPHNLYIREYIALHSQEAETDSSINLFSNQVNSSDSALERYVNPPVKLRIPTEASPFMLQEWSSLHEIKPENRGG